MRASGQLTTHNMRDAITAAAVNRTAQPASMPTAIAASTTANATSSHNTPTTRMPASPRSTRPEKTVVLYGRPSSVASFHDETKPTRCATPEPAAGKPTQTACGASTDTECQPRGFRSSTCRRAAGDQPEWPAVRNCQNSHQRWAGFPGGFERPKGEPLSDRRFR